MAVADLLSDILCISSLVPMKGILVLIFTIKEKKNTIFKTVHLITSLVIDNLSLSNISSFPFLHKSFKYLVILIAHKDIGKV